MKADNLEFDIGPFLDYVDLVLAVQEYEEIRREGSLNMLELSGTWDGEELAHLMSMYDSGEAQRLLSIQE